MIIWCLLPILILYFLASLFSLSVFLKSRRGLSQTATVLASFGALLHVIYLSYLYGQNQLPPLALLALGVVVLFFGLTWLKPWQGLGAFFLPLTLILFLFSLSPQTKVYFLSSLSWLITIHILLALTTLVLLAGNFVLGLSFWIQSWGLKQKKWETLFWRLPPLLLNEKLAAMFLRLGFVFLALVLLSGALLQSDVASPHIALALLAWMIYGWMLAKSMAPLSGRKMVLLSGLGFVSLWTTYLWS